MSIETRLEKFAAILRKAVKYGPDDYNPDDETVEEAPSIEVEEDISDIEDIPEVEANPERIQQIREVHQEKLRKKELEDRLLRKQEKQEAEDRIKEERQQFMDEEVDMNVPASGGLYDVLKKREDELEEALSYLGNDEYDQEAVQAEVAKLKEQVKDIKNTLGQMEEGTYVPPAIDRPDAPTETPYDRATDTAKNQEAIEEIQETLDEVKEKEKRDRGRADSIDIDDVLVLAETMYNKDEAKKELGGMNINELRSNVIRKYNELNPDAKIKDPEAVEAKAIVDRLYAEAGIVSAEKEDDPYAELKEMSMGEKIDSATFVQLYALDKLFTKQLEERKKDEAKDEDETVDPDEVQENLDKLLGKGDKPNAPGPVKRFTPEEIAKYQEELDRREKAASEVKKPFSVREATEFELEEVKPEKGSKCEKCDGIVGHEQLALSCVCD